MADKVQNAEFNATHALVGKIRKDAGKGKGMPAANDGKTWFDASPSRTKSHQVAPSPTKKA